MVCYFIGVDVTDKQSTAQPLADTKFLVASRVEKCFTFSLSSVVVTNTRRHISHLRTSMQYLLCILIFINNGLCGSESSARCISDLNSDLSIMDFCDPESSAWCILDLN